jgi:hypothetical protein
MITLSKSKIKDDNIKKYGIQKHNNVFVTSLFTT